MIVFFFVLSVPKAAKAICWVDQFGIKFLDTDCDRIVDYDDMYDGNFDGIPDGDPVDNCPTVRNGNCDNDIFDCDVDENGEVTAVELAAGFQIDWNHDDIGDACDDADLDGVIDYLDNCRSVYNPTQDPAFCDDSDGDRFEDAIDNCPEDYNPNQVDTDGDGFGDYCDNCRKIYNPAQNALDCPTEDDGSSGSGTVQYSTTPPQSDSGFNYDYGTGTMKGNGASDGCSLTGAQGYAPAVHISMLLIAVGMMARRRRK